MMMAPLKIKSYRHLFLGQFFSDFGAFLDIIALNILIIYVWKLGPAYTSALLVIFAIPMVVIGPFTAVWVDRLPKKVIMFTCDILRVAIALSLVWTTNVFALYALVFLKTMFGAMFDPARQSTIRRTVPEELLLQASTLSQILANLVKIISPAIGSALMLVTKPSSLFIIESVGFFISAVFILGIPKINEEKKETSKKENSFFSELKAGIVYIRSNWLLGYSMIFLSVGMLIVFLQEALTTPWARNIGFTESQLGYIMTANGIGLVIGSLSVGKWTFWKSNPLRLMIYSGIASGIFMALFGLGDIGILLLPKMAWVLVFFIIGVTASGAYIPFGYTLQRETPANLMGRVSGVSNSMINSSMLIGPIVGGLLATLFGTSVVFIGAGLLLSLYSFIVLIVLRRKFILVQEKTVDTISSKL
ncbi:MFS transporter [Bacillus sp. FJAT-49736]|uniref:MFS transporter n=1 Tax=Bacillus sp. FJAT-49736 TaxID=2833582 RepID=UPI001BC99B2A|nr:MFS transporter [Bacillus sp. FJAT-49736]MBS4172221.1 MFS transporter [Bacillus sp. FJAT-49736]